ncbi:MAG: hypothetical protein MN733_28860 [Nitrososphaera sp.]|nr:hypothetical protein [Nitrososphaera sp.]
MCPQNPAWWDITGNRCWFLAQGLAARFNAPVENFSWMTYEQLELATLQVNAVGLLNNAAILPSLALREDPRLVLQALQEFGCQAASSLGQTAVLSAVISGSGGANPYVSVGAVAVAAGVAAGVGLLLVLNAVSRQLAGSNVFEGRITPTSNRDWDYLARRLGISRDRLSQNLHSCKEDAGVPRDGNVQVDDETGDIYYQGEYVGNLVDGC